MIQDTAQRRAEAWMTQHGCYGGTMLIDLANLLQDTRRDALTEARRAISKLYDEAHTESADYYTALLDAGLTLDRLREGVEG